LVFKFPVASTRNAHGIPVTPKARVLQQLIKCAAQLSYEDLVTKMMVEDSEPVVDSKVRRPQPKSKAPVTKSKKKEQLKPIALIEFFFA
jgi:hypothetical protein